MTKSTIVKEILSKVYTLEYRQQTLRKHLKEIRYWRRKLYYEGGFYLSGYLLENLQKALEEYLTCKKMFY